MLYKHRNGKNYVFHAYNVVFILIFGVQSFGI